MSVLKVNDIFDDSLSTQQFNLMDIEQEARRIIAEAEKQCEGLRQKAQAEIEAACAAAEKQAQEKGYQAGLVEGQKAGHEQALQEARDQFSQESSKAIQALTQSLQAFDQIKHQLLFEAEQGSVRLAVHIAQRVVNRLIETDPDIAAHNVRQALELIGANTDITVYLNQADHEHLEKMNQQAQALGQYEHVRFAVDPGIEKGGCRVLTNDGEVDGRLDVQLRRIAEQLVFGGEHALPDEMVEPIETGKDSPAETQSRGEDA